MLSGCADPEMQLHRVRGLGFRVYNQVQPGDTMREDNSPQTFNALQDQHLTHARHIREQPNSNTHSMALHDFLCIVGPMTLWQMNKAK